MGTYNLLQAARSFWQSLPAGESDRFRFLHDGVVQLPVRLSSWRDFAPVVGQCSGACYRTMIDKVMHHIIGER